MAERREFTIEVGGVIAPDGTQMVKIQLPNGYAIMTPDGARQVAFHLISIADEIDGLTTVKDLE